MPQHRKPARQKKHQKPGFVAQYFRALRFYLVTGLLVWIPLIVTIWLTWWLFRKVGLGQESLVRNGYEFVNNIGAKYGDRFEILSILEEFQYRPGFGVLIAILIFLTTGFLTRYIVGRRMIASGEKIVARIPLISRIYRAVRQIVSVFASREGTVFQRVCLVEYPRPGIYAVAFVTSSEKGIVQEAAREKLTAVFLPTTPNPTSGFLLYIPNDEIVPLDITVEEAMKLIISGGAYLPGKHDLETEEAEARRRQEKARKAAQPVLPEKKPAGTSRPRPAD